MSVIIPFEIVYNGAEAVIESRVPAPLVHLLHTGAAVVHKVSRKEDRDGKRVLKVWRIVPFSTRLISV